MYKNIQGVKALGHMLKSMLPTWVFRLVLNGYHGFLALIETPLSWYAALKTQRTIARIAKSDSPVRIGFYVVLPSMFQWRRVFELMMRDDRFAPFIVVVPRIGWQEGDMEYTIERSYASLVKEFGEEYVYKGYHDGVFDNHLEDCDVCAMMNLYSGLAERSFEVLHFSAKGIPVFGSGYFYYQGSKHAPEFYGMRSLKFVRRYFCSNKSELQMFIRHQSLRDDSDRVEMSGCPKTDDIAWEPSRRTSSRKTILIAPHHSVLPTVDSGFCIGNFLRFKDFFLDLPKRYTDIDWIIRPHPHLKLNLIKNANWTVRQWADYIKSFISFSNAEYEDDGPYYESFRKSDAIIHDCASFLPEYFYTGKPPCYILADETAKNKQFDDWGASLIDHTYRAYSERDIVRFIETVVIGGCDSMKNERQKFAREHVMVNYPHASEAIVESIANLLGRSKKGET